jgi:hypothetical protein
MENKEPSPYIISFLTLRKAIGILGVSLPAVLLLGTFTIGQCQQVQESISHYYFTIMGDVLVGTLCAVGVFLMAYKGYNSSDNIATNIAGVFALIVSLFATSNNPDLVCTVRFLPDQAWRVALHYAAAALLFLTLAFISLFLFTKSKGAKTARKIIRNKVYVACGILMVVALLLIVMVKIFPWFEQATGKYHPVFWLEWVALAAFGTSWLVKGEVILSDKD